jgi:peroxiredoxin
MKNTVLGLIILLSISCNESRKAVFSLTGYTTGIENGTVLYLQDILTNELIDSILVENNHFKFQTKLFKTPLQIYLRTRDWSHYREIWLENNPMTFNGTKTDFGNATIEGSYLEHLSQTLHNQIDTLSTTEKQILLMEFVKKNPKSILSAFMLSSNKTTWGKEKTTELFEKFSIENKNSEYGKQIAKYIRLNKEPKIGEQFVDFEMTDLNGNLIKLSDLKGKTILLEFWASWCVPCRQENPNLVKTYKKFNSKGFEVFAVSLDENKDSWHRAIEKDSLNWEHGTSNEALLIYGISSIPDNFLIDQNGVIIGRNLSGDKLNEKLEEIM